MTLSGLFRLNGFALVLAAVVFAVAEVLSFSIFARGGLRPGRGRQEQDLLPAVLPHPVRRHTLARGSVGFYLGQSEATGRLGLVGFLPCVIYSPDLTVVYGTHPGYNAP